MTLRRTGTSFLVKDEWRVTQPLAQQVTLTASEVLEGAPVTVGGKEIGKISDGKFTSLAYPGSYEVSVGGSKYFTGGTEKVSVGAVSSGYVDFCAEGHQGPRAGRRAVRVRPDRRLRREDRAPRPERLPLVRTVRRRRRRAV
ncbi:hypothetical protein Q9Q99_05570 [Curtobacterium flaccumfaciens]|nr:hypothetical protein Q9Q99_05570 [Curtobacterium flaccumfaciens]